MIDKVIFFLPGLLMLAVFAFGKIKALMAKEERDPGNFRPFVVSEYLDRMEKTSLDILEGLDPVDQTIVLWWGLDGLKLNEDGSTKWISRKNPKPVNQGVFCQPCQTANVLPQFNMCQSTQATINALQTQIAMQNVNMRIQEQLQSYQVRYPGYYAPYYQGGTIGYTPSAYFPQMQNCCFNVKAPSV